MRRVLLSHPHAGEVANRTAAALEDRGLLARYFTGIAAAEVGPAGRALRRLARIRPVLENRVVPGVDPARVRPLAPVELAARLAGRALKSPASTYDALFALHDAAVAGSAWPRGVDTVVAYEDAAHLTFLRARRAGLARCLDLPAPHFPAVARALREEHARWDAEPDARVDEPTWKVERKSAELRLASAVSVASRFVASTLEGEAQNILVSPYGFPTDRFTPKVSRGPGPFTVLALGALSVRKGTPYLLEAWRRAGLRDARLVLVGRMDLSERFLRGYAGIFEHVPSTPRARLGEHYRAADLVVFPAIADGFGLVVLESMCSGTPVLATRASGGPDCITDGEDGLLAPARDVDALVDLLRVAARDLDRLEQMGKRARVRAEARSWAVAGRERSAQLEALRG